MSKMLLSDQDPIQHAPLYSPNEWPLLVRRYILYSVHSSAIINVLSVLPIMCGCVVP